MSNVERAAAWFIVARQSFSGVWGQGWSYSTTETAHHMAKSASRWLHSIDGLAAVHARLCRVQFDCQDFRKVLDAYDSKETLFYIDPPYLLPTRRSKRVYVAELSDDDHKDLVAKLLALGGKVILSGYDHAIYRPLEWAGWTKMNIPVFCYSAARTRATGMRGVGSTKATQSRTETIWQSPGLLDLGGLFQENT